VALLAIATPTLADQSAVDKCVAAVTKKLRANIEEAASRLLRFHSEQGLAISSCCSWSLASRASALV
jgi:hypothetical protein